MDLKTVFLGSSIVTTGLVSGLLYGWSVSVIPGTRRLPAHDYINVMQNINKAILNPAFVIPFMSVPLLLGGAAYLQFRAGNNRRGWLLVGAATSYVVGVLGVTVGGNIPLNDALDTLDLSGATSELLETHRRSYESSWNRWHYVRTVISVGSFALTSAAALATAHEN